MKDLRNRLLANGVRYIAIEGNIGAGKTTLSKLIAGEAGGAIFQEEVDGNPFISKFYQDTKAYAFQAQLFFLLNRYRQQTEIAQRDLFSELIVADYLFAKDSIFANVVLEDDELVLYNRLLEQLRGKIATPDLVIYLQATPEVLKKRLRKKGAAAESAISDDYLEEVARAYEHFFFHYTGSDLLIVNTSDIDFVDRNEDLQELLRKVSEPVRGTQYFLPLGGQAASA